MDRLKVGFLLPKRDNSGRSLRSAIRAAMGAVYDKFDGWSSEGNVKGAFRMADGSMAEDESARYTVFIEPNRLEELVTILQAFK